MYKSLPRSVVIQRDLVQVQQVLCVILGGVLYTTLVLAL